MALNRRELEQKAISITGALLQEKGYIAFVDVFMKLGYLSQADYEAWRRRRIPYLEKALRVNLSKINVIMKAVIANSRRGNLRESYTAYMSWGKGRKTQLRFSKSGKPAIERAYATHFLLPKKDKSADGTATDA